jgi:hypothetical protein
MNLWEYLDFSSAEPKFFIKGKARFATASGALLNFFALIGVTSISLIFFIDFFLGKQFSIIFSQVNDFDRNLNLSDVPILFGASNTKGQYFNNSIIYFLVQYVNVTTTGTKFLTIQSEVCEINKHFGSYKKYFQDIDISNYYCIVPGQNINLFGKSGDTVNGNSNLAIFIARCDNSSQYNQNPGKCASKETIENSINSAPAVMRILTIDYQIDHTALGNPFTPYVMSESYPISTYLTYRHFLPLIKTFYTHDDGYIFEDKKNFFEYQKGQQYFSIYVNTTLNVKEAFSVLSLAMSSKAETYLKTYVKLPVIIANIGGVMKLLLMVASMLNYKVKSSLMMVELINDFFDYEVKKKDPAVLNIFEYSSNKSVVQLSMSKYILI